ncbi:SDR family oxidoreductase [Saccharopolyspora endophytica]|uniref:SDR family oxidoreductase n=1 Tax=Saccharopolyspora endophytica TaxID=543886 RepID=A0ABS5DBE3_9PSEU|nr:SDR family oxidoreductase [Saccharopolyspora endophytica]MBQ0923593.1 SDR family oxidoreductase [Saccharopolyspora endophytica]
MKHAFDLSGKVAAVSGSTRGIGRSIALGLAEAGADVALLQRSLSDTTLQEEIRQLGRKCEIIECDVENRQQVRNAVPETISRLGGLHIVVPCAGIQHRSPSVDFPEEDWDRVMQVNLKSVWLLCQQAGRHMVEQGYGKIITIGSVASFQGGFTVPAYAAAKGGIAQLTKALANEWAAHNVNVNALVPGYIDTDMNTALVSDPTRSVQISERIPAARWGTPDDFKGPAVFLASDAAAYVHGHLLAVDGGWLGR